MACGLDGAIYAAAFKDGWMTVARPSRGDAALRSAARTIEYEFRMFLVGVAALSRAPSPEERNLVLEALLIHARNLRDFFAASGKKDDILAVDFVSQLPRVALPYLRSPTSRRRLNRLVAHASYSRPRLGKNWDVNRILRELEKAMRSFLERFHSESPGRLKWFGDLPGILDVGVSE